MTLVYVMICILQVKMGKLEKCLRKVSDAHKEIDDISSEMERLQPLHANSQQEVKDSLNDTKTIQEEYLAVKQLCDEQSLETDKLREAIKFMHKDVDTEFQKVIFESSFS